MYEIIAAQATALTEATIHTQTLAAIAEKS